MNIIQIINYIGLAQGVLLGVVLTTVKRGNRKANRILGIILILFSTGMFLHQIGHENDLYVFAHHKEIVIYLFLFTTLLFYGYVQTLTHGDFRFSPVHVTGPAIGLAIFIAHLFLDESFEEYSMESIGTLLVLMILIYIPMSFRVLYRHNRIIRESFSSLEKINLNWLRNLLIAFSLAWILTSVVETLRIEPFTGDLIWLIVSIFIYWIGYMGLVQPEIFTGEMKEAIPDDTIFKVKYEKSTLTKEKADEWVFRIRELMSREKPFLENDINLSKLAKLLTLSTHELSQILNENFGQNFFEFINQYRIMEAKELMCDPKNNHLNIAAIGYESGFNSISAFNTAFKKFSDMTPSQYRSRLGQK